MKLHQMTPGQKHTTKINWDEIKRKVTSLQEVIEQKEILLPEEKRALLKKRAHVLALRGNDETVRQECVEIILFRLAYETYGIETAFVREVYPLKDMTTLPGTPSFVLGIINVRGQIVSVIDLKKFFNLQEKGLGELNKVIIIYNERMEFGILADVVEGTQSVALKEIMAAPPSVIGIGKKYLKGVTKEHIVLLDAESILNDEKIIVNEEMNEESINKRKNQ
ncbi:MAG: chemotaxis protein CheW [Ignavibacteriales bacterium]|nr:chemotaxis protein CheW [Ignavibacteriales bacterium]